MLKDCDIIYFANDWNADNRTSSHHIASLLGDYNRILYVEAGGLRAPSGSGHDLLRIAKKIWRFLQGSRTIAGKKDFRVISLFLIPFHRYCAVRAINRLLTRATVNFHMKRLKIKRPIVFFFFPHIHDLCGALSERLSVYYCIDDYASYPGVNVSEVTSMDEALTGKVDVTFVVSSQLLEKKRLLGRRVWYSPHGVDLNHFAPKAGTAMGPIIHKDEESRKVVLYWGLVADWMDVELVKHLVCTQKDKRFVFLGRVSIPLDGVQNCENVSFLGPVDYAELPGHAAAADVLIIPFKINDWTNNINPIKLKEYLATGKPVVSTAIPEAVRCADLIRVATDKEEFSRLIDEAILNDTKQDRQRRLDHVSELTWERRVDEISCALQDLLDQRRDPT